MTKAEKQAQALIEKLLIDAVYESVQEGSLVGLELDLEIGDEQKKVTFIVSPGSIPEVMQEIKNGDYDRKPDTDETIDMEQVRKEKASGKIH